MPVAEEVEVDVGAGERLAMDRFRDVALARAFSGSSSVDVTVQLIRYQLRRWVSLVESQLLSNFVVKTKFWLFNRFLQRNQPNFLSIVPQSERYRLANDDARR